MTLGYHIPWYPAWLWRPGWEWEGACPWSLTVAIWWFSKTDLSLYKRAKGCRVLTRNVLVLPGCSTSWTAAATSAAKICHKKVIKLVANDKYNRTSCGIKQSWRIGIFNKACVECMTSAAWSLLWYVGFGYFPYRHSISWKNLSRQVCHKYQNVQSSSTGDVPCQDLTAWVSSSRALFSSLTQVEDGH